MVERNPEDKLKEAVLTLQVLEVLERWVADLDAARDQGAADKVEELKCMATDLIDFRAGQDVPSYASMLRDCEDAADEYALTPEARRRQLKLVSDDD